MGGGAGIYEALELRPIHKIPSVLQEARPTFVYSGE